jgi:hypothetical protein
MAASPDRASVSLLLICLYLTCLIDISSFLSLHGGCNTYHSTIQAKGVSNKGSLDETEWLNFS